MRTIFAYTVIATSMLHGASRSNKSQCPKECPDHIVDRNGVKRIQSDSKIAFCHDGETCTFKFDSRTYEYQTAGAVPSQTQEYFARRYAALKETFNQTT